MTSPQDPKVKTYWEKVARDFDSIYTGQKSRFLRWLDLVLRKDMYERLRLSLEECQAPEIQSILDIGCGSGRFCLPLAKTKTRVVGLDYSAPMLEIARREAQKEGVGSKCEFREGDFLQTQFNEKFDAILGIGLFDYIAKPEQFLLKIRDLLKVKLIATWPTLWTWRVIPRWIRLNLKGCPVYFWTPRRIRELYRQAKLEIIRFERVGKIYFVVAKPGG